MLEDGWQGLGGAEELDRGRLPDRKPVGGENSRTERGEHFHEPAAVAAEPHNAHRGVGEIAGGLADEFPPRLLSEKERQSPSAGDCQAEGMFSHLVGEHA